MPQPYDVDKRWLSTVRQSDIPNSDVSNNFQFNSVVDFIKTDWLDQCFDGGRRKPDISDNMAPSCGTENETKGEHIQRCRTASKPHSTPLTLKWLEENYEVAEGVCIPRNALYMHYLDYCSKNDTQPVNAASFGKIIRQQFSHITTRRLGTRGQSKYHYYGIGVKETSAYYDAMYSSKNVQGYGNGKREPTRQMMTYSPRTKLGTLLPDFPDIKDLRLPPNIPEDKVLTFLMMYRTHCQRILDTVIRANFDEVSETVHLNREILPNIQNFLVHFWQGMPQHMTPLLGTNAIVTLVGVCDSILYKAIANVLMPSVLQALPESLTQVIRKFARQLDDWLNYALYSLPENLRKVKFDLARRFCQVLRRQTSLNHLCQAARTVTQNPDITGQMVDDWMNIDLSSIVKQTLYTMDHYSEKDHQTIANCILSGCREFERLLEEQAPIECFLEWLDTMVDRCVVKPSSKQSGNLRTVARQFLLMWSCFGTRVIRDMTLQSSPSFGSFHLLHLMFDDYVLCLVENLHSQERVSEFLRNIRQGDTSIDFGEELMPSTTNFSDGMPSPSETMTPPVVNTTHRPMERCSVITNGREVMNQVGGSLHPDYTCQRNTEVTNIQSSHSPVDDNSQAISIKSPYSPAADSGRSSNSSSLQNTLTSTPINHIAGSTYQQCQPYPMAYGQTLTNQHTATMETQNTHPMYSYDVPSQYSRHYLSAASNEHHAKSDVTTLTPAGRQSVAPVNVSTAEWPTDGNGGNNRYGTPVMPHESVLRVNDSTNYSPYQAVRTPTYDYTGYAYPDNYPRTISNSTTPETTSSHTYHHSYTNEGSSAASVTVGANSVTGNTSGNGHVADYYDDGRTEYGSAAKRKYDHHQDASRHYKQRYHNRDQYPPYHVTSGGYM